ncbi:stage III sporulation protein AF [Paenibacillus flagellatus]|uniref:Stage III sporulation protein AF n=1 Tax=Paenibacillus flagellatus TaxID=2211139 RepID=A0A2V5K6K7_9BACL|nr:stage III sporulation protein AF [Paenibacillus flagellatus]PYI55059.1 stage III sporulation protein AF [Paenibacillus flagellatus]
MIAWLSGWLKDVILVVLLAAFVDLLLPNNALQRYVKTVLGLFILLTLLSPLLSLFQEKWDPEKLVASVERLGSQPQAGGPSNSVQSLQAILRNAERWRQDDRNEAQRIMERELAAELQRTAGSEANVAIKQVKLQMKYDNNGTPSIEHMQVVLDDIDGSPPGSGTGKDPPARKPIGAVEPVHIDIRVGTPETKPEAGAISPERQQTKQKLYDALNRQWQLSRDQVTLLYETELRKER